MTQANRRRGWAALMPAQSKIALRASGVDDIFDTPALQSIQWRHNVAPGGGITVNWVAELTVSSNYVAAEAKRLARKAKRKSDRAIDSNGKWEVVNGVQFIPDSTNPRG